MTPRSDRDATKGRLEREAFLQELGEASVLPAGDEHRVAVEARVRERGGWAAAHWEALPPRSRTGSSAATAPTALRS